MISEHFRVWFFGSAILVGIIYYYRKRIFSETSKRLAAFLAIDLCLTPFVYFGHPPYFQPLWYTTYREFNNEEGWFYAVGTWIAVFAGLEIIYRILQWRRKHDS